jgi:hypothetical protein
MEEHKHQWKNVSLQLLEQYAVQSNEFIYGLVMGDESLFLHFDLETKWQHGMVLHNIALEEKLKWCP